MTGVRGNRDLVHRLRALRTTATLLHLGAHPDDEDAGMIARLSLGDGVRVVYWSATRGEGGQNLSGPERGAALGVVRTWESLSARLVDGGEVLYGPFFDAGFSKTGEATLARWGREDLVREIVRAIRLVQPHVVVSRWSGRREDGHGHHEAIGLVVGDAFSAASDPASYPELDLPPWKPSKLYRSLGGDWQPGEAVTRGARVDGDRIVAINAGEVEPVSGLSYEELASIGLNRHRTQGMAMIAPLGDFYHCYELLLSEVGNGAGFFDGIDASLVALADDNETREALARAQRAADAAAASFRPDDPRRAAAALTELVRALRDAGTTATGGAQGVIAYRLREAEDVLLRCLGVRARATADPVRVSPGSRTRVVAIGDAGDAGATIRSVRLEVPPGWAVTDASSSGVAAFDLEVPEAAPFTTPYWLREPASPDRYVWPADAAGHALDEPPVHAVFDLDLADGTRLSLRVPAGRVEAFPGGTRSVPLTILPPIGLRPEQPRIVRRAGSDHRRIASAVAAEAVADDAAKGVLEALVPEGWTVHPAQTTVACRRGEREVVRHDVTLPAGLRPGTYAIEYSVEAGGIAYGVTVEQVVRGAGGARADAGTAVEEAFLMRPARSLVDVIDVDLVPGLRYGYVVGVDDGIPPVLLQLGADVTLIPDDELAYGDLSLYDAIVVGPRAYVLRTEVRRNTKRLLDYTDAGGTLIVQHQGYGYDDGTATPYPFVYAHPHDRVTDPQAPVRILDPNHAVFTTPNPITEHDLTGWRHERGLYFFGERDPRYVALLECADPGEDPKDGGLVIAPVGRGTYVYTGYSFFRQIPEGVPGAVRLFANLLSLPDVKIRERVELLRHVPLFSATTDAELYEIARLAAEQWFEAGAELCREGDRSDEMFVVIDGDVDVARAGVEVARAARGAVIGELAILTELPRTATLRARRPVRALVLRGVHLRALLTTHPAIAGQMMQILAQKLAAGGDA